jgi:putative lipoic acid-binding regulatory protein
MKRVIRLLPLQQRQRERQATFTYNFERLFSLNLLLLLLLLYYFTVVCQIDAWITSTTGTCGTKSNYEYLCTLNGRKCNKRQVPATSLLRLNEAKAGSYFNPVPAPDPKNNNDTSSDVSKATQPSTINGIPTEEVEIDVQFGMSFQQVTRRKRDPITQKPYVGIGPSSLNDITKPVYDDQGYTLYVDEKTGVKTRVFEALLTYPCIFTLKVVGANENNFIQDILSIVSTTCQNTAASDSNSATDTDMSSTTDDLDHSVKYNGKWVSITIHAPVQSSQMLYQLYENVDRDPRVKFKF